VNAVDRDRSSSISFRPIYFDQFISIKFRLAQDRSRLHCGVKASNSSFDAVVVSENTIRIVGPRARQPQRQNRLRIAEPMANLRRWFANLFMNGAPGRTRTSTALRLPDFESALVYYKYMILHHNSCA